LEYLVGEEAQKIFVTETMEYPVRSGVAPHPILSTFGNPKFDFTGLKRIAKDSQEALRILDEVGWR
jgi:ABC-type Fe3+ transport system substrate-binding protein